MYSQCPDCQARFRVTAEMLRAARGTVRCGRCGSAFDALERLSDTIPPASPALRVVPAAGGNTEPAATAEYHFSAEDLERVFVDARDWREAPAAPESQATLESAGASDEPPLVVDENAGVEDITLEGERIRIEAPAEDQGVEVDLDSTDEIEILRHVPDSAYPEDEDAVEREIEALARGLAEEQAPAPEPLAEPVVEPPPEPVAEPVPPTPEISSATATAEEPLPLSAQRWRRPVDEEASEPAASGSAWGTFAWSVGGLVLALVLAAQVIHHFRQDLVRHPQIGPPLRTAYERLGLDLLPNWDLAAFELRQWGNAADAAAEGRMVVRASLTNRAGFAQPHPILRLELEDRFGATVATRDFEPADYLKNPSQATRLIAPGSSSEAELLLADPGTEAVGYRLDVCLRESSTLLRCARGPG
jgi:predicted Zn finger-like uncharacterized protein